MSRHIKVDIKKRRISTEIMSEEVYLALAARTIAEHRQLRYVVTDLIQLGLSCDPFGLRLDGASEELIREISAYASLSGRTIEQQILFDLCEGYGVKWNE